MHGSALAHSDGQALWWADPAPIVQGGTEAPSPQQGLGAGPESRESKERGGHPLSAHRDPETAGRMSHSTPRAPRNEGLQAQGRGTTSTPSLGQCGQCRCPGPRRKAVFKAQLSKVAWLLASPGCSSHSAGAGPEALEGRSHTSRPACHSSGHVARPRSYTGRSLVGEDSRALQETDLTWDTAPRPPPKSPFHRALLDSTCPSVPPIGTADS